MKRVCLFLRFYRDEESTVFEIRKDDAPGSLVATIRPAPGEGGYVNDMLCHMIAQHNEREREATP